MHKKWTTEFKGYCEKIQKAVDFDAGGGSGGPGGAGGASGGSVDASSGGSDRRKSQSTMGSFLTQSAKILKGAVGAVGDFMGQEKAQVTHRILTPLSNSQVIQRLSIHEIETRLKSGNLKYWKFGSSTSHHAQRAGTWFSFSRGCCRSNELIRSNGPNGQVEAARRREHTRRTPSAQSFCGEV